MATLNEIAYNIRNVISGGVAPDDTDVSLRQIKFMKKFAEGGRIGYKDGTELKKNVFLTLLAFI